ncbi:MAG: ketopantoate reductase family protein [Thermotaleaceae bacterium]
MIEINRIVVAGLGAIGSAYGSKLHDLKPEAVKFIVNEERKERYQQLGLRVNGKNYDFNYILPEETGDPADLVLVSVKFHDLSQVIEDIRNHVGTDTIILSLLNGITSEEILGEAFGMEKMLYANCVGIDAVREGREIRYSHIGKICFGEKENSSLTSRVQAVKALFEQAGIPYEVPEDMMRALWWKYMLNVGVNQVSAILRAPYGVFQKISGAQELMKMAMEEVFLLSQKEGVRLYREDMEEFFKILNTLSPEGKTSMLQDIEAGRKTEVEMLAGAVCDLGRKHGIVTPINDMLFRMIRILEIMNEEKHTGK